LRLALCQINPTVGDLQGNARAIAAGIARARAAEAELVLFGELALTGYPPEDLLLREDFLSDTGVALNELADAASEIAAIVGFPERAQDGAYNAAAVLRDGAVESVYRKEHLPNYGVFDEQRYFRAGNVTGSGTGSGGLVIDVGGLNVGVTVCEDLWMPGPPASAEAALGARLIVNISASPYHAGKGMERERLFAQRARENGVYVAFCGLVGGQDELVFDGHSFVLDRDGRAIARAAQFEQELLLCDLDAQSALDARPALGTQPALEAQPAHASLRVPIACEEQEVYRALMLGLRDYVHKNGFGGVVLGLSGGIDSALVACLAADALGLERVNVAIMPSPFSSGATQRDARELAANLGVRAHELAIAPAMDAYAQILSEDFAGLGADTTEENLQARIRGNLLMALSNKFGWLVLATGNKSEMSVGYTTLYGDLAGGFAVIKDVPKTLVYRLARWRNSPAATELGASAPIPASIVERAPSAELRENQLDQDSLPPYELLDRILHGYIELDRSRAQLIADGLPAEEVHRVTRMVDLAEYKRRQAPPGIKITERAFGRDRRMPITNAYQRVR
jgi:NAD+ synthase (glutamine-hydrolysing)